MEFELVENKDMIVYLRDLGDDGVFSEGDQVMYVVASGDGCTSTARAAHPIDDGVGNDYGGTVAADANGALHANVSMAAGRYQACYFKPSSPSVRRRRLGVAFDVWALGNAYIRVVEPLPTLMEEGGETNVETITYDTHFDGVWIAAFAVATCCLCCCCLCIIGCLVRRRKRMRHGKASLRAAGNAVLAANRLVAGIGGLASDGAKGNGPNRASWADAN